jgi:hypothetical protein
MPENDKTTASRFTFPETTLDITKNPLKNEYLSAVEKSATVRVDPTLNETASFNNHIGARLHHFLGTTNPLRYATNYAQIRIALSKHAILH